jgi:hypothetical protein
MPCAGLGGIAISQLGPLDVGSLNPADLKSKVCASHPLHWHARLQQSNRERVTEPVGVTVGDLGQLEHCLHCPLPLTPCPLKLRFA